MAAVTFGSKLTTGQSGMGVFDVVTASAVAANTVVSCRLNACVFGPFVKLGGGLREYVAPPFGHDDGSGARGPERSRVQEFEILRKASVQI